MTAMFLVLVLGLVLGGGWILLALLLALTIGHGIRIADGMEGTTGEAIRR